VTPAGDRTLFDLFGAMVVAARRKYGAMIPWFVMTSPANHDETVALFERFRFFGLPREDVRLFPQGVLPAFDPSGRVLLADRHRVALSPDGHGGSLKALVAAGAIEDMRRRGVEIISYYQVDNPLVKPFDPLFIGLHAGSGSEMSTKVTSKADDRERVGNVCRDGERVMMIEYSELPDELAHRRNADGRRTFDAANLAVHLLNVAFVERIVGRSFELPYRRAEKIVPHVDDSGELRQPTSPNAVKLEMFVFDALPLAKNPLVFEVDRAEEFSPVKNATGVDSLETARRDQVARACRWLETAGVAVPRRPSGEPDAILAIDPLFALDADDVADALRRRAADGRGPPEIRPGDSLYLE
jgi:UDP-N-acetylglucosamine/UDP-N-acetylgalactosamine diphosphorylase